MAKSKEEIYDELISPLMQQVLTLCKDNSIAVVASFDVPSHEDPGVRCTSCLVGYDESSKSPRLAKLASLAMGEPLMFTLPNPDGTKTAVSYIL